jgi:predicted amidohydrolase
MYLIIMKFTIATSQFPVSSDIFSNSNFIITQMRSARSAGAELIHFPEGSLSGYVGVDFESFENYPWNLNITDSR